MKRSLCLVVATLAIVLATFAHAQSGNLKLKCQIPFSFAADGAQFSAGEYVVTEPSHWVLMLRNVRSGHSAFKRVTPAKSDREANVRGRLVFHRYGSEYFLVEVSDGSIESTYDLRKLREEKRLANMNPRSQLTVVSVLTDGTVQTLEGQN